ncbi:alanine--tRNA ligase, mitochondrial-like [Haliotis rubra]|uniref:alanine--tRNA ligase, mitochondrial-like n=1 Tax=Haliotis rubra TaxID=36100 RepID=UPI001EE52EFE|nr:alanine--tRNA ligase, mitochondrial-like [Haliotis rubra]
MSTQLYKMYPRIVLRLYLRKPRLHLSWRYSSSWSSSNVRGAFISYFRDQHDHIHIPSSSVVPNKKQGTYFTNAGMIQFKPLFLGVAQPGSRLEGLHRAVNSQKCIRVGGKHNDLEDVGHDLTHHTFFEMLGSWSFGDYFKQESCQMALELLTRVYNLPLDRLYFTYFGGSEQFGLAPDVECRDIWLTLGSRWIRVTLSWLTLMAGLRQEIGVPPGNGCVCRVYGGSAPNLSLGSGVGVSVGVRRLRSFASVAGHPPL